MRDEIASNLSLWEGWTDLHMAGEHYDVEGFIAQGGTRPFDWVTRGVVGDVAGKRLLHLQCHIGLDTLRLELAGAIDVTGVDYSPKAVAAATTIARRLGLSARFIESDVRSLPDEVARDSFDVVFTSYGTISWYPDLEPWAESIASRLVPGGVFHIIDSHPFLWVFDDEAPTPPPRIVHSYFSTEPLHFVEEGSYGAPDSDFTADSYSWQHTFGDIVGALIGQGLVVRELREYPVVAWQALHFLEKDDDGLWRMPAGAGDIPMMFSLTATKPPR